MIMTLELLYHPLGSGALPGKMLDLELFKINLACVIFYF